MKFSVYDTGETAMNYQEAMKYMEKVGTYGIVPGLDNIRELCRRLGDPQNDLKFVHIAGTNGKGSTLAYISNILQAAGYRVGKYISPVIIDYCEKIQIGKQKITHKDLCDGLEIIREHCEAMVQDGFHHPTPFEIETALAFLVFPGETVRYRRAGDRYGRQGGCYKSDHDHAGGGTGFHRYGSYEILREQSGGDRSTQDRNL